VALAPGFEVGIGRGVVATMPGSGAPEPLLFQPHHTDAATGVTANQSSCKARAKAVRDNPRIE
jgi:hypothetical protein